MKIDNIFVPARAALLFRKYMVENRSVLLFSGLFIFVVMLLIALISGLSVSSLSGSRQPDLVSTEIGVMLIAFFLFGCRVASGSFSSIAKKPGAISLFTTPVTAIEQCVVRWIFMLPVYLIWSIVCVWLADGLKYVIVKYVFGGSAAILPWGAIFCFSNSLAMENIYMFMMLFIFIQSLFFLGSVFWRRHNFIKSVIVVGLLFVVYMWAMTLVRVTINDTVMNGIIYINERDYLLYWPIQVMMWFGTVINYSLTVMRLKEYDIQGK